MMPIGLDMAVYCDNEYCGDTLYLIIQPLGQRLTALVVKPNNLPASVDRVDRLVPITRIIKISDEGIWLNCSLNEFSELPSFTETYFIEIPTPGYTFLEYGSSPLPAASNQTWMHGPVTKYNTPPGEMVIGRQVQIEAKNGHVGQFEEFVVQLDTGEITHLVFQRGHLWDRKREIVPASAIDYLEGDTIYLNVSKSDLARK